MKKIVCVLLVVLFILTTFQIVSFAESAATITLEISDQSAGDFVEVKIELKNNPGIVSADLKVSFSENLKLVDAENGSAFSSLSYIPPKALSNGLEVASGSHFVWSGFDIQDNEIKNGTILTLKFRVIKGSAEAYQVTVTSDIGDVVDRDMNSISLNASKNIVAVGDVNSDGNVDTSDLAAIKIFLSGSSELTDMGLLAGDLNGDSSIDTTDLAALKLKLAGVKTS